jgi:hypothetical protein
MEKNTRIVADALTPKDSIHENEEQLKHKSVIPTPLRNWRKL